MSSPRAATGAIGWFGKIPALGDFVVRRLPNSFVQPWDEWLSKELSDAREEWADAWPALYRSAPITCFSVSAGVLDEHTWCGILVPSFDRVGREFPLTISCSQPANSTTLPPREWWAALIDAARRALETGCGANELDDALTAIREFESPSVGIAAEKSIWWPWPDEPTHALISDNLPRGACFRKLLASLP